MSKLKNYLPSFFLRAISLKKWKVWKNYSNKDIFSKIYNDNIWGKPQNSQSPFFSGDGSHNPNHTKPYLDSVSKFLLSIKGKSKVVDLGCGDFNIGSQLSKYCDLYIGCDVVPQLIEYNEKTNKSEKVSFKLTDITKDDLPIGDVVVIRQVLQHLSNEQIIEVLKKNKKK